MIFIFGTKKDMTKGRPLSLEELKENDVSDLLRNILLAI